MRVFTVFHVDILLPVETNPIKMCRQYFDSAALVNSKLDY